MESEVSDYQKSIEQLENNTLDLVRRAEKTAVEAARKWADDATKVVPVEMRQVRQVITAALDFTERVLKIQRDFAERLVRAAPVPGTKVTPKPATKATHDARRPTTTTVMKKTG